jgi:mandelate racemase
VETAAGVLRSTPLVLIDLERDGIIGRSYLRTYTPLALQPLASLVENLATVDDPAAHVRLLGAQGLVGMALAGLDMARWDAEAQAAGLPLAEHLGGRRAPVPAYASLRSMSPGPALAEAEALRAQGFTAFKVKSLEAVRALRGVGRLMVDFNQSLRVDEALALVPELDELELDWIEEPTRADDYAGHARIAAAARTPVALGESCWGPHDLEKALAAGAADHVTLDAMKIGGVSGWLRAAALTSLPVSSHTFPEISAHLLAVTPTAHRLEYLDHAAPILAEPIRIEDGHALIPDRPGTGLEWDEDAIRYFSA